MDVHCAEYFLTTLSHETNIDDRTCERMNDQMIMSVARLCWGGVLYEQSPFLSPFLLPAISLLLTLTAALSSPIIYFQRTISPADANHGDLEVIKRYIFSPFAHVNDLVQKALG